MRRRWAMPLLALVISIAATEAPADEAHDAAAAGLKKAVTFFHDKVATEGGYLWRYSADLKLREGEGKASATTIWVQPPGTPAVGLALLRAYERTHEAYLLDAAKDAASALIRGQLQSGGWNAGIDFDPAERKKQAYRVDGPAGKKAKNISSFDDNKSQSAFEFLMRLDKALNFKDAKIHDAVTYGLSSVLTAQRANGAWSQVWDGPVAPDDPADLRASFPQDWPHTYPGGPYWWHYTFNDGAMSDTIELLLDAAELYNEPKYREAALRGGDFILRAQLPEPQPAWAQQYDRDMHPAWARKFEPPAITASESQRILRTLLKLYQATHDEKYLKPIPPALAWLKRSTLPDGQLARFYELQTNKPLYMTTDYKLTYEDNDLPTHYGFKGPSYVEKIDRDYELVKAGKPLPAKGPPSAAEVKQILAAMDDRGAWVEQGTLKYHKIDGEIITCERFIKNVDLLSAFLEKK